MTFSSEAHVLTEHASQYIAQLCRQLGRRAQEQPQHAMRVEWTQTDGTIEFGWARATLRADETGLWLRAEADEEEALGHMCELITRHVEAHADEPILAAWSGLASGDAHEQRRDRMRAFHARMRRER